MVLDIINSVLGITAPTDEYDRRIEAANKTIAGAGVQALKEFKEEMASQYGLSTDYSTSDLSTAMTEKARNKAKETTGTLTAQNSQSQAYNAQNAQQNAGINKSQAAMSGQNAAAGNYEQTYNDTLESQTNAMTSQLQDQYDAAKEYYTTQRAADITFQGQQEIAEADKWLQSQSSITGNIGTLLEAVQNGDWQAILKMMTGYDSIKDLITNQIPNLGKSIAGGASDIFSKVGGAISSGLSSIGSGIRSLFSDEELKNFEEVTEDEALAKILQVLSRLDEQSFRELYEDEMGREILTASLMFIGIYKEVKRRDKNREERRAA